MNEITNNHPAEGSATPTKPKSIKTAFAFVKADGTDVTEFPAEVAGVRVKIGPNGEETRTILMSDYEDQLTALAFRGLREVLRNAVSGNESVNDAVVALDDVLEDLGNGVYSDRTGERGLQLDRFVAILAAAQNADPAVVKEWVEAAQAKLGQEKTGNADNPDETKFDVLVREFRKTDEYKAKARELYPSKPRGRKAGEKVTLGGLFQTLGVTGS